jgi:O-antigen/teichoic acid export membrane protein
MAGMTISLKDRARLAVAWNTGFTVGRDVLQFALTLVLVRLLTPDAYGQFGLVVSVTGFLNILSFQSFVSHALQVRDDAEARYQEHFTAGGVIQGGLFLLTNAVALVLSFAPPYAAIAPLVHVMSLAFLLDWPSVIRATMLERQLDWRRLRSLNGMGMVSGAVLSIALAVLGAGVWALLVPGLVFKRLPFILDLFVVVRWRPAWRFDRAVYRPAWLFGVNRLATGVVTQGRQLLESGVLVHALGFVAFGLYGRAVGLAHIGCQKLTLVLMQSLYPVLTKIEPGTPRYGRASSLVLRSVTWTVIPVSVLLATLADPVVRLAYGRRWLDVIPMVPWAAAASAAGAVGHAMHTLLLANQRQQRCLLADLAGLAGVAACLGLLAPSGLIAYLKGLVALHAGIVAVMVLWMYRDGILSGRSVRGAILTPALAAALGWLGAQALTWAGGLAPDAVMSLLLYSGVFAVTYAVALRALGTSDFTELVRQLRLDRLVARAIPTRQ